MASGSSTTCPPSLSPGSDLPFRLPNSPARHTSSPLLLRQDVTPSSSSGLRIHIPTISTTSQCKQPDLQRSPISPTLKMSRWGRHRQEPPFIPVDPFNQGPDIEQKPIRKYGARECLTNTLRQAYLLLMLGLPSLYFSRIARVFEEAEVSQPDIDRLIRACQANQDRRVRMSPIPQTANVYRHDHGLPFSDDWTTGNEGQQLIRFKNSWESFIDSLLREWKTLNLVSALLLSATLSMFTNQAIACNPAIRSMALLSLTFALMSLSYGCIYIVRFTTMKSMYKATRWAQEVQGTSTNMLWNVWIMLALPGVWLAWSMILFIASILVFVWRSGSTTDPSTPSPLPPTEAYATKTVVSFFFFVGGIYFSAIVNTLHGYGRVKAGGAVAEAAARETRDPIREERGRGDVDREMEMGATGIKMKGHERPLEKDQEHIPREDDGHKSELSSAVDDSHHGSSSLDVLQGLSLGGLGGMSPHMSDEQELEHARDVAHDVVYEGRSPGSVEGKSRDGVVGA
ncbi:hypothetical protein BKA82DRAFT_1006775 [Pisolithus tinctorius]|nr:hypothetical protein BKA82DRAFT_1006775 [Pisolithus tinctorius]